MAGLALGLVVRLIALASPTDDIIARSFLDDAYYDIEVARHWLEGDGLTFDGRNPTNGYHLTWTLLEAGLVRLTTTEPATLTRLVVLLGSLLDLALAAVLFALLRRLSSPGFAKLFLVAWVIHPSFLSHAGSGMDTSLSTYLAVLAAGAFALELSRRREVGWRSPTLFTLAFWARPDALALILPASALLVSRAVRERRWHPLEIALVPLALAVPYFLYHWTLYGRWTPASTEALRLRFAAGSVGQETLQLHLGDFARFAGLDWAVPLLPPLMVAALLALGGLALVLTALATRTDRAPVAYLVVVIASYLGAYGLLLFLRERYLFPALTLMVLLAGVAHRRLLARALYRRLAPFLAAFLLCAITASSIQWWSAASRLGQQRRILLQNGCEAIERRVPEASRIGSFNAGILRAFTGRDIVNLDGLINNAALQALDQRELVRFIGEQGIDHVFDFESHLTFHLVEFGGSEQLAGAFDVVWQEDFGGSTAGAAGRLVLLKVR